MNEKVAARWVIALAAVMWSTSGFFAKSPFFADWPLALDRMPVRGPLLAFWRAAFATVVLIPFVRRPRWTPKLIPLVAAYAAMNYAFLNAMTLTTEANAIWLQYTAPVWVFAVGVFVLGEPVDRRDGWLLLFCALGVGLILCCEIRGQSPAGVIFGLLGGVTYAAVVLCLRQLRREDGAWLVMLSNAVTALLFFPFVAHYHIWPSGHQMLYLAGFGMFQMGLPYLLFARAVRHVVGHEASAILLLEPLLVPVWVFIAWGRSPAYEPPAWWTLVGGACILAGLAVRYAGRSNGCGAG